MCVMRGLCQGMGVDEPWCLHDERCNQAAAADQLLAGAPAGHANRLLLLLTAAGGCSCWRRPSASGL